MAVCRETGVGVLAAGSGPAFFACQPPASLPRLLLREIEHEWGVRAIAVRTLDGPSATAMREV
jgi:hypothetical protein